jgi:hypothetical protein
VNTRLEGFMAFYAAQETEVKVKWDAAAKLALTLSNEFLEESWPSSKIQEDNVSGPSSNVQPPVISKGKDANLVFVKSEQPARQLVQPVPLQPLPEIVMAPISEPDPRQGGLDTATSFVYANCMSLGNTQFL